MLIVAAFPMIPGLAAFDVFDLTAQLFKVSLASSRAIVPDFVTEFPENVLVDIVDSLEALIRYKADPDPTAELLVKEQLSRDSLDSLSLSIPPPLFWDALAVNSHLLHAKVDVVLTFSPAPLKLEEFIKNCVPVKLAVDFERAPPPAVFPWITELLSVQSMASTTTPIDLFSFMVKFEVDRILDVPVLDTKITEEPELPVKVQSCIARVVSSESNAPRMHEAELVLELLLKVELFITREPPE
mmetsp:Transcript_10861/g.21231  ORF Transcript_10861/g.21231 Transcript_10861/m.21231 type:complete len:242 (+) Transcript_10861:2332-3057(+)